MALLELKNLKTFFATKRGTVKAVNGVSYSLDAGKVLGVVGESGSGKSVFTKTFMGLLDNNGWIDNGHIYYHDYDLTTFKKEKDWTKIRGQRIAMVFQDPMTSLNPLKTVGKQIQEAFTLHNKVSKAEAKARTLELLADVGIPEPEKRYKQYPHEFSGGMRQRVVIAIAMACNPRILICDEPTTALDVTIQAQILELMMELKDKLGMAIIMITHDLGIVASMCDRIAVMYAGRIVETGTCDEIFYHPKHEYTKGLLESIPRLDSTKHEKLIPIEGNPVDLLNPPEGCAFAPRCKNCMKICLRENPPKTDFSKTHYAHCFMNQKAEMEGGNTNE